MPEMAPGERTELWFTLSASSLSPEEAERTCRRVQGRREELLREKREVYEALAETAALRFPKRPEIEETYRWTQYLNDWIVRDVEQVGRGAVAGYAAVSYTHLDVYKRQAPAWPAGPPSSRNPH